MKQNSLRLFSLIGILLLSSVWLFGQAETGVITGTVTDSSNAVVPGATVTVVSTATGLTRTATTAVGRRICHHQPAADDLHVDD